MAVTGASWLAASAPAPVYPAVGEDGLAAVEALSLHPAVSLQASPRHASLLLVCGRIREADRPALRRLHDQLPHPRATLWWRTEPVPGFPAASCVGDDRLDAVRAVWRRLATGALGSEADLLPDEPPAPWRGKGDHGQGGEGMTGGKPYGRPMAMTEDDRRDGLALDAYTARLGPFLPMLPPGLRLELTIQGDAIQSARVPSPPYPQAGADGPLRRIARLLPLLGLAGLAERFRRAAQGRAPDLGALGRALRRSGALHAIPPGLGGFAGEDLRARLRRWWAQAEGADLRAPPGEGCLADLLPGLEWSEAMLVANSFDPEILMRLCPAGPGDGDGS